MNIEKLFVSYDIAKQLKDKWFNEPCLGWFQFENYGTKVHTDKYWKEKLSGLSAEEFLNAPLYQQVLDWFRETYGIGMNVVQQSCEMIKHYEEKSKNSMPMFFYYFTAKTEAQTQNIKSKVTGRGGDNYHELLIKAIEEALKLI